MDGPLMRKINGKLFLALLLGSFALTGSVFAVHHFQYRRIAQALLWQARRAEDQGQVDRQARYLQRYLEFNPRDLDEKATLARAWTSDAFAGNTRNRSWAVSLLDEVLTFQDDPALRRLLVRTALEVRKIDLARSHLQRLLPWQQVQEFIHEEQAATSKSQPLPDRLTREDRGRGELESLWGQVMEEDKKPAQAIGCYRLAIRHAPEEQLPYIHLAQLLRRTPESDPLRRRDNQAEADRALDRLVQRNESSFQSYLARWRYRRDFDLLAVRETANRGQVPLETAAEDVAQALKRKPQSVEVLLAAADLERLRGRAAAEDLNRTPEQRRKGMQEHRERAAGYLRRGLERVGNRNSGPADQGEFQLLWHKGNLLLDDLDLRRAQGEEEGAPARAEGTLKKEISEVIEQVAKSRVPAAADYMRARLLVNERRWAEAASLFERARTLLAAQKDLACQADLYLGQCYERLEEHTQMYNAFKRVADWDPTSVPALMGMAAARWAQGQLDNALAQYEVVMKQKRVPPRGWIDIARLEIQRQAQSEKPDWRRAESALDQAEKINPPRAQLEVNLLRAEVLMRQARPDDARHLLTAARDRHAEEVDYWTALIDLAVRQKQPAEARTILDEARKKLGDRVGLRLAEARLLAEQKGAQVETALNQLAEGRTRFTEEEQARLLSGLADTQLRLEKPEAARKLWQTMAALPSQKNDLRLRLLLFDLAMRDGDEAGMRQTLADIREVEQAGGSYHRYGHALYLIWQARKAVPGPERRQVLERARVELDGVLRQRPSWPPIFLARAEIAQLNGNPEQAIKDLQEAIKNGEGSPSILRRLVSLLTERGRDGEADLLMARLRQAVRLDPELKRLAVGRAVRRGDADRAVELAREIVRDDTKDPQELVWMARVLAAAKKTALAEKKLQEAIAHGPSEPLPWVAMVQFLVEQKKKDRALEVIEQARAKLPAESAGLALGRCYDAVQNPTEAQKYYQQALKTAGTDAGVVKSVAAAHLAASRAREAEPLLRQVLQGKLRGTSPTDIAWARRNLATVLASGTDYQRFREALELVGLKLDGEGRLVRDEASEDSTEDRRARARVLASQAQKQFRQKAIELLEGLRRGNALTADDQFILAMLYESDGDTRNSRAQLELLSRLEKQTPPQYLAQHAMSLIVQRRLPGDLERAEQIISWLDELERQRGIGANAFASVELRARMLEAQKKGDEALKLLRQHAQRSGAQPTEILLVLASLSRQGRFKEAYALCEKTWDEGKCPPEIIGGVSVSLLGVMTPPPSDAQVAAVERRLRAALTANAKNAVLRMHLAQLHDRRGEYEEAAKQYRTVLETEPNNVVALNNLAWLLIHRSGDAREALEHINKAVNGIGRRADLLDTRGLVYLALEDTGRAVSDLREAASEAPTPVHLYHLARALHAEKNSTKAREVLMQARQKGLEVARLHPVEQEACRRLLAEYGIR